MLVDAEEVYKASSSCESVRFIFVIVVVFFVVVGERGERGERGVELFVVVVGGGVSSFPVWPES